MEFSVRSKITKNKWLAVPLLGMLLLGRNTEAQYADTFEVGANGISDPLVNYTTPIWATNFVNGANGLYSTFSYNLYPSSQTWLNALYNGWHATLNFTNLGEMDSITGFYFETQTLSSKIPAANFYNSGSINCGSYSGAIFLTNTFFNGIYYGGYGGINVWATNIVVQNYGAITVGPNGLARFGGKSINFDSAKVSIQSASGILLGTTYPNIDAIGQADYNTNKWVPANTLGNTYADAPLNKSPYGIYLFNSVPFFKAQASDNTGSNVIVRIVFLQDNSVNVTTNVYLVNGQNFGTADVEWVGTYTDPATGQASTRYLYLENDFVQGSSTNILSYGDPGTGVPSNFSFLTSTTPLNLGAPAPTGDVTVWLDPSTITNNIYSYLSAQFIPSSVSTIGTAGTIPLNLLPGRVEITASNAMNFTKSSISGMNYLLLNSSNQFDYGQSSIAAPYSDIYIGHTNGSMTVSNLLQSSLPQWSGTVQAYSTRWTNTFSGINYDFRVLLVASALSPVTGSQVQNLAIYSSNNVVISDMLNIVNSLYMNCTNLLLTTNGLGIGAASAAGELNLSISNSWASSLPRLRCLTNNGAISTINSATYGSAAMPYLAMVNSGRIDNFGNAIIYAGDFENYGSFTAGAGTLTVQSQTASMTNATVQATGSISLAATNMIIAGTLIQSGNGLTLTANNLLTDAVSGTTNANFWTLGANYPGFGVSQGLVLPTKPLSGDLLGTTITNLAAIGTKIINNTWAGEDRGYSVAGYANDAAIGQLVLNAQTNGTQFYFTGTGSGVTNALYVDCLRLLNYADYTNRTDTYLNGLSFNTNLVIYYAQAISGNGISVAQKINGFNDNHLRWVAEYAGRFSSTNVVYPDGTTNTLNAALVQDKTIDSDGDGIVNSLDPTPIFVPSQMKFSASVTNVPPLSVKVQWKTIPQATNYIEFTTNLASPVWLPFTNFSNFYYGANVAISNSAGANYFISPQPYPSPATNVWVFDSITDVPHYYRVFVQPIYP